MMFTCNAPARQDGRRAPELIHIPQILLVRAHRRDAADRAWAASLPGLALRAFDQEPGLQWTAALCPVFP